MTQLDYYETKLKFEFDPADLYHALQAGEKVIPVDCRKPGAYNREHIPGAVNFPHREMSPESTLHMDRSFTYVTYCDGIGCNASTKGAINMTRLGFKVRELIGGIEWWKFDGYATEGEMSTTTSQKVGCAC